MKQLPKALIALATLIVLTIPATTAWGGLKKADKKRVKEALSGTLYMRIDAPCATGRHAFGTYKRPLVEVSPEGSNTEAEAGMSASLWHVDTTYWGISINDPVEFDEMEIDGEEIEIELKGVDSDNGTVIKLVQIHTFEDFEKAFDRAFARRPLQDEHDDWSAEIKKAIGERQLVNGMTKKQAYYVTGTPMSFEKREEGDTKIEIWNLRQDKGMKMGFFKFKAGQTTGFPASIRFENGKLVDAAQTGTSSSFSLDDN